MDSTLSEVHLAMQVMLVVWIALVVLVIRRTIARGSVGLSAAMVLSMSFLYGGAFVYSIPGYTHLRSDGDLYLQGYGFSETMVVKATFASILALLGFAIGSGAFRASPLEALGREQIEATNYKQAHAILLILGGIAIACFSLNYLRADFPFSAASIEMGRNLAPVVICLGAFLAKQRDRSLLPWLAVAILVPAYYLFLFAFLSYGFLFGTLMAAFWMAQIRHPVGGWSNLKKALASCAVIYILLVAFVGWFSFRNEFRSAVWDGDGISLSVTKDSLSRVELLTPANFAALDLVNIRLNLNIFIGRMIEHHELYPELRQYGATLIILPFVLIPRILWQAKPERGGSGFMQDHTGMHFSEETTFGTGSVFEFYVNFGYAGVFVGFLVLGYLLSRLDSASARHLQRGEYMLFARLFVIGIVVIDPLLRPFFIVNGAVFAWIVITLLKIVFEARQRRAVLNQPPTATSTASFKEKP